MRPSAVGSILLVVLAASAGRAAAQETGTPFFKAPYRAFQTHEFGGFLSDPGEGVNLALEGFYHYARGAYDFGLQGGFEDLSGPGGTRALLGGDFRARVIASTQQFPLDGALTVGFGMNVGDGPDRFFVPVGVSLGRRFQVENSQVTFVPYVHPVLVPVFGGGDSDVDFAFGLGVDLRLTREFSVRVSGGLGDIEGIGVGLAFVR